MGHIHTRARGTAAEKVAAEFLESKGYDIVDRNFYTRFGEIDLVVRDSEGVFAFVEVKYRAKNIDGGGFASITERKLSTIRLVSGIWLSTHRDDYEEIDNIRIDVIDVGPGGVRDHLEGVW
ncbi:MAG TPA: YraN family protein [Candidatus Corynebacterium gallistercoris]|uniref:UPF0102 protein H9867_07200 n=1 Tax=Candidatus Corynebacterium gallistercoris TaxID=2838530 RepID=A0A9D1UQE9_9CORY|nr:YraN family protein [Candidatus Corynebacterium gallistercoris]